MDWVELLIHGILWLLGFWVLWKIPFCIDSACNQSVDPGDISIIIPARNEEHNLPILLASLKGHKDKLREVIVVDDSSTDNTLKIAKDAGVKVISLDTLPEGWMGKNWACHNGAKAAAGKFLMFLDADTRLSKGFLDKITYCIDTYRGVVSIQPYHRIRKIYENLSLFFNIILIAGMGTFTPLQHRVRAIGAFGPCLICSRTDYEKVNGHEGVKNKVMEDIALGKRFTEENIPVFCIGGKGTIDFRMYPKGIKDVLKGWSKGFSIGAKATSIPILLMVIAWIAGSFFPLNLSIQALRSGQYIYLLVASIYYLAYVFQLYWMSYRIGSFSFIASLFYPIQQLFFVFLFLYSVIIALFRKRVSWKDRKINT